MSDNSQVLLIIWTIWIGIVGLDLFVLLRLRSLRLPEVATVLWTIWIIVAPVIGAVSFLIVRLRPSKLSHGFEVIHPAAEQRPYNHPL